MADGKLVVKVDDKTYVTGTPDPHGARHLT
jgi:hypothetical protein